MVAIQLSRAMCVCTGLPMHAHGALRGAIPERSGFLGATPSRLLTPLRAHSGLTAWQRHPLCDHGPWECGSWVHARNRCRSSLSQTKAQDLAADCLSLVLTSRLVGSRASEHDLQPSTPPLMQPTTAAPYRTTSYSTPTHLTSPTSRDSTQASADSHECVMAFLGASWVIDVPLLRDSPLFGPPLRDSCRHAGTTYCLPSGN